MSLERTTRSNQEVTAVSPTPMFWTTQLRRNESPASAEVGPVKLATERFAGCEVIATGVESEPTLLSLSSSKTALPKSVTTNTKYEPVIVLLSVVVKDSL